MPPTEAEIREVVQRVLTRLSKPALQDEASSPMAGAATGRTGGAARRPVLDEATVRAAAPGSRLPVGTDTLVTPLARQVAMERGIQIGGSEAPALKPGGSTRPRVAIGADHGGYPLKEALRPHVESLGYEVVDCGTFGSAEPVDYPDIAFAVARLVADGKCTAGIVIDGAGIGSCMAANKVPGVRAALCYDHATAENSREHNHANVLTLGAGLIGASLAKQIVSTWLATPYGPGRHAARVEKIMAIEKRFARQS